MATLSRLIFYPLLIAFFLGKLFPVIDIFIVFFAIFNIFSQNKLSVKNRSLLIFILISIISNLWFFNFIAWMYLVRLISLLSILIYPPELDTFQNKFLNIILFSTVIFGYIQYYVWPNLTIQSSQNWDPHLYRLVGTYFDPTFTGLILLFILITVFFSKNKYRLPLLTVNYIALSLTYSRSALLSFLIVFSYIALIKKNVQIFLISLLIFITTFAVLPRMPGEGTKLERSASIFAKIENYQQGFRVFLLNPITGIGYNNIPQLRLQASTSHANSGFDSSLLTIAITTGIFGLILLVLGIVYEFRHANLFYQSLLLAIFIHSLFANSLFYPYTFILLALLKPKIHK